VRWGLALDCSDDRRLVAEVFSNDFRLVWDLGILPYRSLGLV
jgi:hypothetical protein